MATTSGGNMDRRVFRFKELPTGNTRSLKRGNIVKVRGRKDPQMITQYSWRRGAKVVPFEGPINSRRRARREDPWGNENPGSWYADADITHVAVR